MPFMNRLILLVKLPWLTTWAIDLSDEKKYTEMFFAGKSPDS
jgi:hypothetical protein